MDITIFDEVSSFFKAVDWETWNYISMPILTFLGFVVYAITLKAAIRQNRITSSASRIANYEEEIEDLKSEGYEITFSYGGEMPPSPLNAYNFWNTFYRVLRKIERNSELEKDSEDLKAGKELNWNYIDTRSYRKEFMFLSNFLDPHSELNIFFHRVESLLREINSSSLMPEHKGILKRRIRRKLLQEYLVQVIDVRYRGGDFKKDIPYLSRDKEIRLGDLDTIVIAKKYDQFQKSLK